MEFEIVGVFDEELFNHHTELDGEILTPVTFPSETVIEMSEVEKEALESGEDVLITGFGEFSGREKNARRGRNPASGEDLPLEARRVVTLMCSEVLKDKINGKK